jgi:hypothetical protein
MVIYSGFPEAFLHSDHENLANEEHHASDCFLELSTDLISVICCCEDV